MTLALKGEFRAHMARLHGGHSAPVSCHPPPKMDFPAVVIIVFRLRDHCEMIPSFATG